MIELTTNKFKRGLAERREQIGFWLGLGDGLVAEIIAGAGFDWVLIDEEHGLNDHRSILAQLRAVCAPMLRKPSCVRRSAIRSTSSSCSTSACSLF